MKNDNGDYCYDICKQSTPSRDLIIKKDKTGITMALWKHLEKFHHSIYRDLKPLGTQNPLTNFFPKKLNIQEGLKSLQRKDALI